MRGWNGAAADGKQQFDMRWILLTFDNAEKNNSFAVRLTQTQPRYKVSSPDESDRSMSSTLVFGDMQARHEFVLPKVSTCGVSDV